MKSNERTKMSITEVEIIRRMGRATENGVTERLRGPRIGTNEPDKGDHRKYESVVTPCLLQYFRKRWKREDPSAIARFRCRNYDRWIRYWRPMEEEVWSVEKSG